ncbi:DUF2975 domain-containing protein [candidate division KSB1 bacterium]
METLKKSQSLRFLRFITNFSWYFVLVIIALIMVKIIIDVFAGSGTANPGTFSIPAKIEIYDSGLIEVYSESENTRAEFELQTGTLKISTGDLLPLIFLALFTVSAFVMLAFVIYYFRKIFNNLYLDDPFKMENIKRVRTIGYLIIGIEVFFFVKFVVLNEIFRSKIFIQDGDISFIHSFNWMVIFSGLAVLVIAEIFRLGFEIKEEQKLTI